MKRQKWGVIGLAAMLGIAALGCGEKKTEQDNGTDNPATVINWQEETKDAPDAVQGQETLPPELQKLEKWEMSDLYEQGALSEAESVRNSNLLNEGRFAFDENGQIYFSLPDTSVIYTSGKKEKTCVFLRTIRAGICSIWTDGFTTMQREKVCAGLIAKAVKKSRWLRTSGRNIL